ncbi:MAG: GTP cyclohydrolase I FolE2 [Selenomonadaceae bacterium]|nr:GTP cyclohydrolase I FolE2 [Selenomonadaceae bacterium]
MTDVQNQPDTRGIKIQRTGVTRVHLPFFISDAGNVQPVVAQIKFTVALSEALRGTHMSRLTEILTDWTAHTLTISDVEKILLDALEKLSTDFAAIELAFKFFVKKFSPVSEKPSLSAVDCTFSGELELGGRMKFTLGLSVPFTSLCPCSKEISDFGAHNQRSICRVKLSFADADKLDALSIENFVRLIESQGSAEIFPLLKREDEKFVTEAAYRNPKFVEDILRDVVTALRRVENLSAFAVECENFESIHNHNAFAAHEEFLCAIDT